MDTKPLRSSELPPPPFLSMDALAPSLSIPSKIPQNRFLNPRRAGD